MITISILSQGGQLFVSRNLNQQNISIDQQGLIEEKHRVLVRKQIV